MISDDLHRREILAASEVCTLPRYRNLAERLAIRLVHHDGDQEEAISRLPDMINSADAVICPTDCVGDSTYLPIEAPLEFM